MLFCDRQNYQVVYLFRVQVFFFKVMQGLLDNFWTFLNVLHTRVFVVFSELQRGEYVRLEQQVKLLLIKQLVGESNRMFANMLDMFSMLPGIDVSYD
jgi:hypothetical protein